MARTPVELAREWLEYAEDSDHEGMSQMLSDDARFYAEEIRGRRFKGRAEIESYLFDSGFEAAGFNYSPVDDEYAVVTLSLRRRIEGGGIADSTIAMVFKADSDEIVCLDAFPTAHAAFASLRNNN